MSSFLHDPNVVVLISAERPGCGSTTLAESIAGRIQELHGTEVYSLAVGKMLRGLLDVTNEAGLQERLSEINDPHHFDAKIYGEALPAAGRCIVDGKLATTAGPQHISPERPVVSIDLQTPPLFSAKRVLQREHKDIAQVFGDSPDPDFIDYIQKLERRAQHDQGLRTIIDSETPPERPNHESFTFDTSQFTTEEIIAYLFDDESHLHEAPDWEINALRATLKRLLTLGVDLREKIHSRDLLHYEHQIEAIEYGIERLGITVNNEGLTLIRQDLKKAIIDCWYGLMMRRIPRFFLSSDSESPDEAELMLDEETHSWSPEFYKIAEGWPTLSVLLKDKDILDPFAGSGTLLNLLVARGVPRTAIYADQSYSGGVDLNGKHNWYAAEQNRQASQLLFDDLPSWYKPDFTRVAGHVTARGQELPFKSQSVDYIFGDPPYGKNLNEGGIGTLFGCLPEFARVAREGAILLVPVAWVKEIEASGTEVTQLTKDVSKGTSKFPVCYVLIKPDQESRR